MSNLIVLQPPGNTEPVVGTPEQAVRRVLRELSIHQHHDGRYVVIFRVRGGFGQDSMWYTADFSHGVDVRAQFFKDVIGRLKNLYGFEVYRTELV